VTKTAVYNVDKKKVKRTMKFSTVSALSKTIPPSENVKEFVIHIPSEYDYCLTLDLRDEMIDVIKKAYFENQKKNLPIYGFTTEDLKAVTNKEADLKKNAYKMPDEAARMISEDYDKKRSAGIGAQNKLFGGLAKKT